jgi:hypothetical protein
MLCRGEFNFIVASFALSAGVLDPDHYAAVVFAILLSAILAPLALSRTIRYYNDKLKEYLEAGHKIDRIEGTNDGTRPLFLAIQARTPVTWGIQEKFKQALESTGLHIIDHRSWHTQGLDAVDVTEIFCQDKQTQVRMRHAFKSRSTQSASPTASRTSSFGEVDGKEQELLPPTIKESPSQEDLAMFEDIAEEEEDRKEQAAIELRKQKIRDALVECLGSDVHSTEYAIQVSIWNTFVFAAPSSATRSDDDETEDIEGGLLDRSRHTGYRFIAPKEEAPGGDDVEQQQREREARGEVMEAIYHSQKRTVTTTEQPAVFRSLSHSHQRSHSVDGAALDLPAVFRPLSHSHQRSHSVDGAALDLPAAVFRSLPHSHRRSNSVDAAALDLPAVFRSLSHSHQRSHSLSHPHQRSHSLSHSHQRSHSVDGAAQDLEGSVTTTDDPRLGLDLWDFDTVAHDLVSEGLYMSPSDGGISGAQQIAIEDCPPGEIPT